MEKENKELRKKYTQEKEERDIVQAKLIKNSILKEL